METDNDRSNISAMVDAMRNSFAQKYSQYLQTANHFASAVTSSVLPEITASSLQSNDAVHTMREIASAATVQLPSSVWQSLPYEDISAVALKSITDSMSTAMLSQQFRIDISEMMSVALDSMERSIPYIESIEPETNQIQISHTKQRITIEKKITLGDAIALISLLFDIYMMIVQSAPSKQLDRLIAQNEAIISQQEEMIEQSQRQEDSELCEVLDSLADSINSLADEVDALRKEFADASNLPNEEKLPYSEDTQEQYADSENAT